MLVHRFLHHPSSQCKKLSPQNPHSQATCSGGRANPTALDVEGIAPLHLAAQRASKFTIRQGMEDRLFYQVMNFPKKLLVKIFNVWTRTFRSNSKRLFISLAARSAVIRCLDPFWLSFSVEGICKITLSFLDPNLQGT